MNGYNFTERVRKVLQMAREEALVQHHEYVGTEHMLLGLAREGEGVAAAALENLGVDSHAVRDEILNTVKPGRLDPGTRGPDLPYTSRAKKVLELAMSEARNMDHSYVGTEHLLIALMAEEKGIAAQVLVSQGASLAKVRSEVLRLLGPPVGEPQVGTEGPRRRPASDRPAAITLVVEHADGRIEARKFQTVFDAASYLTRLDRPSETQ